MTLMELLKDPTAKRPVIGGHRGHQSDLRENTIHNFTQLLGTGIPYVEIDVQLTRDDRLVIFHDEYLEAATGLPGKVREYALEQLRKNFEIDTVEDSIRWCQENQMGIAFELKNHCLKTPEERRTIGSGLSALIGQFDFHKNCFVFSKDYDTLALIRKLDEDISLGIIPPRDTEKALALMEQTARPGMVEGRGSMLELIDKLLTMVPVWKLQCTPTEEAARVSQKAMQEEAQKRFG